MSQWDLHLGVENADWTKKITKKQQKKKVLRWRVNTHCGMSMWQMCIPVKAVCKPHSPDLKKRRSSPCSLWRSLLECPPRAPETRVRDPFGVMVRTIVSWKLLKWIYSVLEKSSSYDPSGFWRMFIYFSIIIVLLCIICFETSFDHKTKHLNIISDILLEI